MTNVWTLGPAVDSTETYASGDAVPHRDQTVLLNGVAVGHIEIHMHRRYGSDGKVDISFGFTGVVYGPPPGGV